MVAYLKFTNTTTNNNYTSPVLYVPSATSAAVNNTILRYPAYVTTGSAINPSDTNDYGQYFVIQSWPTTLSTTGTLVDPLTSQALQASLYNPATAGFLNSLGQVRNINGQDVRQAGSQTFLATGASDQFQFQAAGITSDNKQIVRIIKIANSGGTLGNQLLGYYNGNASIQLVNTTLPGSVPAGISVEWVVTVLNNDANPSNGAPPITLEKDIVDY